MTEAESYHLLTMVTSKNFNKEGFAVEWHPLALNAFKKFEADVIEVGFMAAYALYDENIWGEGPLYNPTKGLESLG